MVVGDTYDSLGPSDSDLRSRIVEEAESLGKRLTAMSDAFYRHPEVAFKEHETSAALQQFLAGNGFTVEKGVGGLETAFRATWGSGKPLVALIAEMDALPGIGHGCGHNIIGPASAGAAAVLSKVLPEGSGTVVVVGTPAEEEGSGKIALLKAGLFSDVDCAMMIHPSSKRMVTKGFIGLVRINLTFTGRASHASAYPEEGINALDGVLQTFNGVNALRQQLGSDVRIHGIITDGGKAPNIIPEKASATFYVRSAGGMRELNATKERILNCVRGAAVATGCEVAIDEEEEVNAPMKLNRRLAGVFREQLEYLGLEEERSIPDDKNLGSSDIGNLSQALPTIHPLVPMRRGVNIHTTEFAEATISDDGHRALSEGVTCLALAALEVMTNPSALDAIKREFAERGAAT
ncbi:MAG: M20 family metallopeptidase [Thermodesulfobacteriota bacterium]